MPVCLHTARLVSSAGSVTILPSIHALCFVSHIGTVRHISVVATAMSVGPAQSYSWSHVPQLHSVLCWQPKLCAGSKQQCMLPATGPVVCHWFCGTTDNHEAPCAAVLASCAAAKLCPKTIRKEGSRACQICASKCSNCPPPPDISGSSKPPLPSEFSSCADCDACAQCCPGTQYAACEQCSMCAMCRYC
jgi:hypothetical protein